MAIRFLRKKLDGNRLRFIALAFSVLFCASSAQVYRGGRAESEAREAVREAIESLPQTTREAGRFQLVHFAAHGVFSSEEDVRAASVRIDYSAAVAILAHEFAHISKDDKRSLIIFTSQRTRADIAVRLNNSPDDFIYDRLLLEKRWQEDRLSQSAYQEELRRILQRYAGMLPRSEVARDDESLRAQLAAAEQQVAQMRAEVNSLKGQLARAERSKSEKWAPIIIAILSFLIAVSSHVIAWRTDRRQSREAELLPLKREELEKNNTLKGQQISEGSGRIITPSPQELQLYSGALSIDRSGRVKRSKP